MKSALLLDVIIGQSSAVLQLFTSEDQPLLVWGNAFLVLDFSLDVFNCVRRLNLQSKGLDKDLHTTTKTKNQVKSTFLLDVVIRKSSAILELFSSKDQPLLTWGNSLLVLDLGLHVFNSIR